MKPEMTNTNPLRQFDGFCGSRTLFSASARPSQNEQLPTHQTLNPVYPLSRHLSKATVAPTAVK